MKKGMTILEILVAMSIFVMIATMAVGAFVSVINTKSLVSNMRESQQKMRVASEMITRLSRQAKTVSVSPDGKVLTLKFSSVDGEYISRFALAGSDLIYSETQTGNSNIDLAPKTSLLGNLVKISQDPAKQSKFAVRYATTPGILDILLYAEITNNTTNPYYNDDLTIDTSVLLEGAK